MDFARAGKRAAAAAHHRQADGGSATHLALATWATRLRARAGPAAAAAGRQGEVEAEFEERWCYSCRVFFSWTDRSVALGKTISDGVRTRTIRCRHLQARQPAMRALSGGYALIAGCIRTGIPNAPLKGSATLPSRVKRSPEDAQLTFSCDEFG
jgi:hypothetical protein